MTGARTSTSDRVAALRLAFDRSFASVPAPANTSHLDLLAIRVGTTPYALRIAEIAGLFADKPIAPLPTMVPELLGIIGHRGAILPVYDLGALLGDPSIAATNGASPRWLALAAGKPIALAFARLDGHARIANDALVLQDGDAHAGHDRGDRTVRPVRHVREHARLDDRVRPIVSIASVLEAIASCMGDTR
jgi:chemotaxis signal transduction protein